MTAFQESQVFCGGCGERKSAGSIADVLISDESDDNDASLN
jgi:hypothetical protein